MKKNCVVCGVEFEAKRCSQKTCSISCRKVFKRNKQRLWRKKNGIGYSDQRNCDVCGAEFEAFNSTQKRCSKECVLIYRYEWHKRDRINYPSKHSEYQKKYGKEYREKNRDSLKERKRIYYEENIDALRASCRDYYVKHRMQKIAYSKKYRTENKELIRNRDNLATLNLCNSYVKQLIVSQDKWVYRDIPKNLIEYKRLELKLKRKIISFKKQNHETSTNTEINL